MMKISYYAYTNKGGRPNNEDSICCGLQNRRGVFVLADGLGGHSSGEVASGLAAQAIWEGCAGAEILDSETLKGQLEEANRLVLEGQKVPGREDMKTTAVALALEGDLDALTAAVWDALDEANKISLFVRFTDLETHAFQQRIVNKYNR